MYVHYYGYSCIRYISYEFLGLLEVVKKVQYISNIVQLVVSWMDPEDSFPSYCI